MPLDPGVPAYASLPGANHTIYLDFNGHTTTGTSWNSSKATIVTPAFDVDGNPSDFSVDEQLRIRDIWRRVSEDYAPFKVNVTTIEPTDIGDLIKSGTGDTRWGVRVAIGGAYSDWYGSSAGGVAYIGSFNYSSDTPCFVFAASCYNDIKFVADAVSHEVGHTLGLSHDGRTSPSEGYYQGHGNWAPIMGVGYYRDYVTWSKGEYPNANNTEDDLAIITTQNGFGYRPDDYGNTNATATKLVGTSNISASGIISNAADTDVFTFTAAGGNYNFSLSPYMLSPDLDLRADLFDANGVLVTTSNPSTSLSADFSINLAAGQYYLQLKGTGNPGTGTGSPVDVGYTNYASIGQYTLSATGTFGNPADSSTTGTVFEDWDGNGTRDANDSGIGNVQVILDIDTNGIFNPSTDLVTTTAADGSYSFTNLPSGKFAVQAMPPAGWAPAPASTSQNVSLPTAGGATNIDFGMLRTAPAIYGRVYLDQNLNGSFDTETELGMIGQTVYLDLNANKALDPGEPSQVTNAQGNYRLDAATGTYNLRVQPSSGYSGANPADGLKIVSVASSPSLSNNLGLTTLTLPAPAVSGTPLINDSTGTQRSTIRSLRVNFNAPAAFQPGAFSLQRLSDNLTISTAGATPAIQVSTSLSPTGASVLLTFTGNIGVDNGSLADGVWKLQIDHTKVSNSTGTMVVDYSSPTTGPNRIHRLFGDSDGNGTVDSADMATFGAAFGFTLANSPVDFDANGSIDAADFSMFGSRFGITL